MRFSKENRILLYGFCTLPLFFSCLDGVVMLHLKAIKENNPHICFLLEGTSQVIGALSYGLTLLVAACVIYAIGRYYNRRFYALGKSLVLGFFASGVSVQMLKHFIGKARPRVTEQFVIIGPSLASGYDSFPSGHTTVGFCLSYILSQYFPRYRFFFCLFASAAGLVRVEKQSHFTSDAVAGALLGIIMAKLLLQVLRRQGIAPSKVKDSPASE